MTTTHLVQFLSAKLQDMETVYDIQCRAYPDGFHEPSALFTRMYALYPDGCYVLVCDDKPAGYLFMHPAFIDQNSYEEKPSVLDGQENALYIHDLCIDPQFQGLGLAGQACEFIESFVRQKKFTSIIGVAIPGVEEFWKRRGYAMLHPYEYNGQAATFMQKTLL